MLSILASASISLLPMVSVSDNSSVSVFNNVRAVAYAENNSAYDLISGKDVDYNRSESAFTFNEVSTGVRYNNFSLSYIYRYEWFLDFSKDTMEFYSKTKNGDLVTPNKQYDIDLKVNHINTHGLRLAYLHEMKDVNLYFAASYLKAVELMDGSLAGDILLSGDCQNDVSCYSGDLNLDYTYSKDILLNRETDKPKSIYGYSFDIGLDWKMSEHWFTSIYVQDIFSEILWENAPYTKANATTATTVIEDDKAKINPIVEGVESNKDHKQKLAVKYSALLAYQVEDNQSAYLQGFYAYNSLIAHAGYAINKDGLVYRIKYFPYQEAIGLEFKSSMFNIAITSDSFDYQESELFEVRMGISIPI